MLAFRAVNSIKILRRWAAVASCMEPSIPTGYRCLPCAPHPSSHPLAACSCAAFSCLAYQGIACTCGCRLTQAQAGEILWPDQALRSVKRAVCDSEQGACRQSCRIDAACPARAKRDLTLSSGKAETLPVCHGMLVANMPHPQGCNACGALF
jgi:hypothetical protein